MKKICFVTFKGQPGLIDGEQLIIRPLEQYGCHIEEIPWDNPAVDWKNFDLVIIRSTWDYHYRILEFVNWISRLKKESVNLWNKPDTLLWNLDKKYLLSLQKKGVNIIPTIILPKNNLVEQLREKIVKTGWNKSIILKPNHAASAYKTYKIAVKNILSLKKEIIDILTNSSLIVQPYMEEINNSGEYSLVFLGKKYSHAVLKKPASGDFRTQPELGGKEYAIKPTNEIIRQVEEIVSKIQDDLLYARVDGIIHKGKFILMELELIEPYLFLEKEINAHKFFFTEILKRLN